MVSIASSINGRLRIRARELRGASALAASQAALEAIPGVISVASNGRTGSLLIHYDPVRQTRAEMEARACACLGAEAAPSDDEGESDLQESAEARKKWRPARRDINRYAKFGAVTCMAVSLLAIAARQRRLHVWSGAASLVLAGVHMAIHRRTLLR